MRQEQKKKQKDKVAIVLMLCFCVIALTSIFTIKSNVEKINKSARGSDVPASDQTKVPDNTTPSQGSAPIKQSGNDKSGQENAKPNGGGSGSGDEGDSNDDSHKAAQASSQMPIVDSTQNPNNHGTDTDMRYRFPLENHECKIINKYAMDSLIYSKTLDQYMTHQGVDIEAPMGASVVAVTEGTITAVYMDDRFGNSIEITHGEGIKTIYSNLDSNDNVEIGDVVSRGAVIGSVGQSGAFEALDPPHLHFEIIKGGKYVDPAEYIAF